MDNWRKQKPFSPADIDGLQAWFDPSDTSTLFTVRSPGLLRRMYRRIKPVGDGAIIRSIRNKADGKIYPVDECTYRIAYDRRLSEKENHQVTDYLKDRLGLNE